MASEVRLEVPVAFWVSTVSGEELTSEEAKQAVQSAVFHSLALIDGDGEIPFTQLNVDGVGRCNVGLIGEESG